jgi:hypothetical protein
MRILGLCVVLLGATVAYAQQSSAPIATPSGVQSAAQVGQAAPPRCDANCVRANAAKASEACAPGIEAQAPSDFDWIARPNPGIFQEADPSSPADSVVRFRGDSVRFMTDQKSWVRVTYECGYDVDAQKVTYVNVRAGRLDQPLAAVPPQTAKAASTTIAAPTASQAPAAPRPPRPHVGEPSLIEIQQQAANPRPH